MAFAKTNLLTPAGGEHWVYDTTHAIPWKADFDDSVRIELLRKDTVEVVIAKKAPNTGSYAWLVSEEIASGSDYKIRISKCKNSPTADESNFHFGIGSSSIVKAYHHSSEQSIQKEGTTIRINGYTGEITLFSADGKLVLQENAEHSKTVDLSKIPAGIYYLRLGKHTRRIMSIY